MIGLKNLFLVFTIVALMIAMPFASAAMEQGNKILPVIPGKGEMTREQLREKFLGEETFRAELRNRIRECVSNNSEECENFRTVAKEVMKGVMKRVCNNYDDVAERMKKRIDNNKALSDEEKEALKNVIDEQASDFSELCGRIENATPEELREIAKEMRQLMKETKIKFGLAKGLIHAKRVGLVIERAEHLEAKLQDFIEKWNCSSEELQPLIDAFNSKVTEAREAYNESVDLWKQFKESVQNHEPNTELLREAQAKMQLAQLKLREAHSVLKDIIAELRECRQGEPGAGIPVEPQPPVEQQNNSEE